MENATQTSTDTIQDVNEQTSVNETETQSAPQGSEHDEATEKVNDSITVRFNHADRILTAEETKEFAQKGLKLDAMSDMLDDLSYYSAIKGKTPQEVLKELIAHEEEVKRNEILERGIDDEEVINLFMDKYRTENKGKFEKMKADRQKAEEAAETTARETLESRLANEFLELQKEFPEIADISAVPSDVLNEARTKNRHLLDAYLRNRLAEEKKVTLAKQTAQSNAVATGGRMVNADDENDPIMAAFTQGLK